MLTESVKVDIETLQNLRKIKREEGIAISFIIKKAVEQYLDTRKEK